MHALEITERRRFGGQGFQHVRVERVARPKGVGDLGTNGVAGERLPVGHMQGTIGLDDRCRLRLVDGLEQAATQHLDGLVLLGRVQQGRLARGNALGLRHAVGDEAVLVAIGIARHTVLANGQRIDEGRVRRACHRLEERSQEGGQLLASAPVDPAHLAQIDGEFVQQNQHRGAAEELAQGGGTGRDADLIAPANPLVTRPTGQRIGDLAPGRAGQHTIAHRPPVGRIGVLAVEGGDADRTLRHQGGRDELGDIRHARHATGGMDQRDQPVGLAAAIGGIETENRRYLAAGTGQAPTHIGEQIPQAPGGIGVGEETGWIDVFGTTALAAGNPGQVRREVSLGEVSREHIGARAASLEDRRHRHASPACRKPEP